MMYYDDFVKQNIVKHPRSYKGKQSIYFYYADTLGKSSLSHRGVNSNKYLGMLMHTFKFHMVAFCHRFAGKCNRFNEIQYICSSIEENWKTA